MSNCSWIKKPFLLVFTCLALGMLTSLPVRAADNPFTVELKTDNAFLLSEADDAEEAKCGEGKCGEGKCGEETADEDTGEEAKCGEGKCGEGKCGG